MEKSYSDLNFPVLCIYSYEDRLEAITRANRLDAATVMINDHTAFRADWMPFAGRRASGYNIGGIGYSMHAMVQHKLVVHKHS